jgi:hypothetical protein
MIDRIDTLSIEIQDERLSLVVKKISKFKVVQSYSEKCKINAILEER